jgi:2-aminobenzoate-CoA ligase
MDLLPSAHVDSFARDHLPPDRLWPVIETPDVPDRLNAAGELLRASAGLDRPALRTPDGEVWTYADLLCRANQIAHLLVDDYGLVPGNRVLLRFPNTPWAVAAWLGILKAGGIVVATMAAIRARELAPIIARTRPHVALVDPRVVDDVVAAAPDLPVVADPAARCRSKPVTFDDVQTSSDDVALLCPTSGSTGIPKITMHFHRDILSIDDTFGRNVLKLTPDDVVACSAPLAFTFGLGMLVVFPLRAGACSLLTETVTPMQLADLVERERVTVLATAPTAYKQILRAGKGSKLAGLRAGVSAGEHIPESVWTRLRDEIGLRVIDGIGSTELLHIFISAAGDDIRPGATGKPVPGFRATILGPDDEEVGPGVEGRLAVIGPVGCRYLDDDRQRAYVADGWNVTGDTFLRDEDGYFFYRSRTDNMIVSSGYNIGGPEVEAALDDHPDVVEAAVVARPDPERGSVVCAFVVLKDGVSPGAAKVAELQDFVKHQLAPYKYPRDVRFIDALPRNSSGKLQHFMLRRLVEDRIAEDRIPQDRIPQDRIAEGRAR